MRIVQKIWNEYESKTVEWFRTEAGITGKPAEPLFKPLGKDLRQGSKGRSFQSTTTLMGRGPTDSQNPKDHTITSEEGPEQL